MAIILTQTDTNDSVGGSPACQQLCSSFIARDVVGDQRRATSGGTAGTSTVQLGIDANTTQVCFTFFSAASEPNSTSWESGTWTVRFEITTSDMNVTSWKFCVCRVNSSGVSQATVIADTAGTGDFTTTGVKTGSATGSVQTAASSDRMAINISAFNVSTMAAASPVMKPSQNINTPVTQNGGFTFQQLTSIEQPEKNVYGITNY